MIRAKETFKNAKNDVYLLIVNAFAHSLLISYLET